MEFFFIHSFHPIQSLCMDLIHIGISAIIPTRPNFQVTMNNVIRGARFHYVWRGSVQRWRRVYRQVYPPSMRRSAPVVYVLASLIR